MGSSEASSRSSVSNEKLIIFYKEIISVFYFQNCLFPPTSLISCAEILFAVLWGWKSVLGVGSCCSVTFHYLHECNVIILFIRLDVLFSFTKFYTSCNFCLRNCQFSRRGWNLCIWYYNHCILLMVTLRVKDLILRSKSLELLGLLAFFSWTRCIVDCLVTSLTRCIICIFSEVFMNLANRWINWCMIGCTSGILLGSRGLFGNYLFSGICQWIFCGSKVTSYCFADL